MPVFMHGVVSSHTLHGPKNRRHVFYVKAGEVVILKWENDKLVGRESLNMAYAKNRYRFLLGIGYKKEQLNTNGQDAKNRKYAKQYGAK